MVDTEWKGEGVHPRHQAELNLPSWWNVRQKVAIVCLFVLVCGCMLIKLDTLDLSYKSTVLLKDSILILPVPISRAWKRALLGSGITYQAIVVIYWPTDPCMHPPQRLNVLG